MTKAKGNSRPLRGAMYYNDGVTEKPEKPECDLEDEEKSTRINMRVSAKTLKFLEEEAAESGATVSALCSLAVYDWVQERRAKRFDASKLLDYKS